MKLSREKIQRMIGQRDSGNGGGGTSPDIDLSGYVSMNYLLGLKWWGQSLDNGVVVGAMTGVAGITMTGAISGATGLTMNSGAISGATNLSMTGAISGTTNITMTGMLTGATNVSTQKVTIGGFEVEYDSGNNALKFNGNIYATGGVTALGQGSGGGGGSTALADLVDVAISNPTNGQVLKYNSTTGKWYNGTDQGVTSLDWSAITNKPDTATRWPSYSEVTSKPTTLSGYSITDAKIVNGVITLGSNTITPLTSVAFSDLTTHPTTLSGYGITDAKIANGVITLGSNTITPLTSVAFSNLTSHPTTLSGYGITDAKFGTAGTNYIPITLGSTTQNVLTGYTEKDPTVPAWAKASSKPSYSFSEITGTIASTQLPTMYWADVQISNQSNNNTSPQFGNLRLRPGSDNYGSYLRFGDDNYAYIAELTDDVLTYTAKAHIFKAGNTDDYSEVMRISSNKNVGIGTNAPSYKLDVNGTAHFSDAVYLAGNKYYSSGYFGLHCNNSDIVGVNRIVTSDLSDSFEESLSFVRTDGNYDTFRAANGTFFFEINNATAANTNKLSSSGFLLGHNMTDVWNDSTNSHNSHPWYGIDNTHHNTGVYSMTISDYFGISIRVGGSGNNGIYIKEGGNVGVGLTDPSCKLDVNGDTRSTLYYFLNQAGTGNAGYVGRGNSSTNNITLMAYSGNKLQLGAGGNVGVTFDTSNNVGIGTSSPTHKLDVSGDIYATLDITTPQAVNARNIELSFTTPYIDFHHGSSSADFTSRLITTDYGTLNLQSKTSEGVDKLSAFVVGANYDGSFIQIGNIKIVYDSSNNALKIIKSDGTAANFYATGGVSALGQSSGSSSAYYANLAVGTELDVNGKAYFNDDIYVNVGGYDYVLDGNRCVELGILS